jgi:formamidopyrimidine-DNA glycosylase
MPELPEVETVVRHLRPLVAGRAVRSLRILDELLGVMPANRVRGAAVAGVERLGKQVVINLERGTKASPRLWLSVHLRMTGRLLWRAGEGPAAGLDRPWLRARLALVGGNVDFIDPRRFGVIRLVDDPATLDPPGVDPTGEAFTPGVLRRLLGESRQELKPWLLRQDRITGLGNIYASEILARARLNPFREAGTLGPAEIRRLHRAVVAILLRAIRHCGTTFSDFQDSNGEIGAFQRFLAVYGHEGDPCRRCATPVERIVQQGRSTYFCPACQPAGR